MYARTKTFTNKDGSKRTYVQIVEAVREHGKVRQRVVANLGRIDELQEGSLDRLIASLAKFSKQKWIQAEAEKLLVHRAREWGLDLIFRHLWEQLAWTSSCNGTFPAHTPASSWQKPFMPWY